MTETDNRYIVKLKEAEKKIHILENMIETQTRELYVTNTELEQFIFMASHDLQEPLGTILSFVDLLNDKYERKLDDNTDQYLHFITQAALVMNLRIKGLLDYLLIGRQRQLTTVDCNTLIDEVRTNLAFNGSKPKAIFHIERLPQLKGYKKELRMLFQNLISNAIKFRKKGVVLKIEISAQKRKGLWDFMVKDNGIGIEKERQQQIFGIFRGLHSKGEYIGSGVGLFYCRKIVNIHHGRIWVDSCPNEGSTFYFTIPN